MGNVLGRMFRLADRLVCRAGAAISSGNGTLTGLAFHALVDDPRRLADEPLLSPQCFSVAELRRVVEHFASRGYRFITPRHLPDGIDPSGRYVMLTFDDGYHNNLLALPVLREFGVPATVYVSSDHVRLGKAFWWDVLWRKRRAAGAAPANVLRELAHLSARRTHEVEKVIMDEFGAGALDCAGDLDRPLSPEELRQLAADPLIVIGNHTAHHAVLTNYAPEEARAQIEGCQQALADITGKTPDSIAWPDGRYNASVISVAREVGLKTGLSVDLHAERLPVRHDEQRLMHLGRFCIKHDEDIDLQCLAMRSPVSVYRLGQALARRLRHGRQSPDHRPGYA